MNKLLFGFLLGFVALGGVSSVCKAQRVILVDTALASGKDTHTEYIHVSVLPADNDKFNAIYAFGQTRNLSAEKDNVIVDANGAPLVFDSEMDVLSHFKKMGWNFESTINFNGAITERYYMFSKVVNAVQNPSEGLMTKRDFQTKR
ncbi:MAG: hypothetical protein KBT32_06075 [Bacteroidales bacterium]|nr:hypothetical protein [Candidatus Physcocola equi]